MNKPGSSCYSSLAILATRSGRPLQRSRLIFFVMSKYVMSNVGAVSHPSMVQILHYWGSY